MKPEILILAMLIPGLLIVLPALLFLEDHPHPLREWKLWHGPLEECYRCHAQVPSGWIAYQREHFDPLFGITFDDEHRFDHHFQMRGLIGPNLFREGDECCICGTQRWADDKKGKPMRPKFFEYGQNADFGR